MSRRSQRQIMFNSQLGFCPYCGVKMTLEHNHKHSLTRDHVIPRASGGTSHSFNMVAACAACNREKSDHPLVIFLLKRRQRLDSAV